MLVSGTLMCELAWVYLGYFALFRLYFVLLNVRYLVTVMMYGFALILIAVSKAMSVPAGSSLPPPGKRKEIYKYEAPWTVYSMNWSVRPDKRFRLALGSFMEEYNNKVSCWCVCDVYWNIGTKLYVIHIPDRSTCTALQLLCCVLVCCINFAVFQLESSCYYSSVELVL